MSKRKWQRSAVKEQFWRQHVESWRKSRQSVRAYCTAAALSEPSFYSWRRELALRDGQAPQVKRQRGKTRAQALDASRREIGPSTWVQLQVPSVAAASASIEIELAGGTVVRLRGEVNRQALADVLAALTSASSTGSPRASSVEPEARPC